MRNWTLATVIAAVAAALILTMFPLQVPQGQGLWPCSCCCKVKVRYTLAPARVASAARSWEQAAVVESKLRKLTFALCNPAGGTTLCVPPRTCISTKTWRHSRRCRLVQTSWLLLWESHWGPRCDHSLASTAAAASAAAACYAML
jgi:hypothetical protein